ncbi:hypothetical protein BC833DRAFT_653666 [Globomyces pollinis-pini]|nr:hypothetical protein BC833DRAFT_653666 [Globomyces pollinis-pini]
MDEKKRKRDEFQNDEQLQSFISFLERKKLSEVVEEITEGITIYEDCLRRTKERRCPKSGDDIYNFLHPAELEVPSLISPQAIPIRSTLYQGVIHDERLCVVLGLTDGSTGLEGIRLDSVKTIQRRTTVNRIIDQLQLTNVMLVQSPPMTGKTSMAALLTEQLTNIANDANKKTLILNLVNWRQLRKFVMFI